MFRRAMMVTLQIATCGGWVGCSVHYYDSASGTEHLWGFGHMKVKVTPAEDHVQSVVREIDGVGIGCGQDGPLKHFSFGWYRRQRIEVLDDQAAVCLEWCGNDFFNVRVGSSPPEFSATVDEDNSTDSIQETQE